MHNAANPLYKKTTLNVHSIIIKSKQVKMSTPARHMVTLLYVYDGTTVVFANQLLERTPEQLGFVQVNRQVDGRVHH